MICIECGEDKKTFQVTKGRNGKVYYTKKCTSCIYKKTKAYRQQVGSRAWTNRRYQRLKDRAVARGYIFDLTRDDAYELYTTEACYYCGEMAEVRSVDRVDNSRGYTRDNCVMSCRPCNVLKSNILSTDKERMFKILSKL